MSSLRRPRISLAFISISGKACSISSAGTPSLPKARSRDLVAARSRSPSSPRSASSFFLALAQVVQHCHLLAGRPDFWFSTFSRSCAIEQAAFGRLQVGRLGFQSLRDFNASGIVFLLLLACIAAGF